MAKTVQMFVANDGTPFMYLEAAITHDAVEGILKAIPELALMRGKLHANMQAIAAATSSMVDLQRKNHPELPALDHPELAKEFWAAQRTRSALAAITGRDCEELTGTCDCSAGMNGADDHAPTCPSHKPVLSEEVIRAINEMTAVGRPAKDWLNRQGFTGVRDFSERATADRIAQWNNFTQGEEAIMRVVEKNKDQIASIFRDGY